MLDVLHVVGEHLVEQNLPMIRDLAPGRALSRELILNLVADCVKLFGLLLVIYRTAFAND